MSSTFSPGFRLFLCVCLLTAAAVAFSQESRAGEAVLTWTAPTLRTDGTALTNLAGYRIFYGETDLSTVVTVDDPTATTYTVTGLTPGTWYFAMTAFDATGSESEQTGQVSKSITSEPPTPPADLRVVSTTVYAVVKQTDRFVMVVVGSVPAGTACIVNQYVNGYHVVPRAAVTWSGTVKPDVVVAQCS